MKKCHCKDKCVALGTVVNICNDPCDITHPCGTIGAVFALKDTGGIHVCTQYFVLVSRKKNLFGFQLIITKLLQSQQKIIFVPNYKKHIPKYNMELFTFRICT